MSSTQDHETPTLASIEKQKRPEFQQVLVEWVGLGFLSIAEMYRFTNFNAAGIENYKINNPGWEPIEVSEQWLGFLQNFGDVVPAMIASMATYWGLYAAESPFKKHIPEKVKVALATVVGIGVVVAHEAGFLMQADYSKGTIPDTVYGAIGSVAFAGLHMMIDRYVKDLDADILKLEKEIGPEMMEAAIIDGVFDKTSLNYEK